MKQEFIDKVNNCLLDFYINLEASGIDDEDGSLCADEFDHVNYSISDGKLFSWHGEELMDLADLDDSWFEGSMNPEEDDEWEPMTWFDCFITALMNHVIQNEIIGDRGFYNMIYDRRILIVSLKDSDSFDVIEEIDDWDIEEHVD